MRRDKGKKVGLRKIWTVQGTEMNDSDPTKCGNYCLTYCLRCVTHETHIPRTSNSLLAVNQLLFDARHENHRCVIKYTQFIDDGTVCIAPRHTATRANSKIVGEMKPVRVVSNRSIHVIRAICMGPTVAAIAVIHANRHTNRHLMHTTNFIKRRRSLDASFMRRSPLTLFTLFTSFSPVFFVFLRLAISHSNACVYFFDYSIEKNANEFVCLRWYQTI